MRSIAQRARARIRKAPLDQGRDRAGSLQVLRALRQLEDERTYQNVQELARLQSFVAESLKRFEFGLRRKVDADKNASALTGSDEVPEEVRKLVEQYDRSLARSPR